MLRLLNCKILLDSKGLSSLSLVGRGESPRVRDNLFRPEGVETWACAGDTMGR